MANGVFISYRRSEAAGYAGRIADYFSFAHPSFNVFMDVNSIRPGSDFVSTIKSSLAASDAVLALIGEQWLYAAGASGERRLDDPQDFVRMEIELALNARKNIIPILLDNASMPISAALPESIRRLASHGAFRLRHDAFKRDVDALAEVLLAAPEVSSSGTFDPLETKVSRAVFDSLEADFRRLIEMDDLEVYMIVTNPAGRFVQFIGVSDGEVLLDLPSVDLLPRQLVAAQRFLQESYTVETQDLGNGALALQTTLPAEARHLTLITLSLFEHVHESVPDRPLEITFGR